MTVIALPTNSDTTMAAPIIGSISRPELVAVEPCTICWNSGRKLIAPNMAKPSRKPMIEISVKLRLANSCSGMIGSTTFRSTATNSASVTAAIATRVRICQEPQAYSLPPQVVMSTRAVMPTDSRPAPAQSIRTVPPAWRSFGRCSCVTIMASAMAPIGRFT